MRDAFSVLEKHNSIACSYSFLDGSNGSMSTDQSAQTPKAFIQHLIHEGFLRHRIPNTFDDFEVHELDLTPLKLNVSIFVPFIVPKQLAGASLGHVLQLWRAVEEQFNSRQKITVLLIGGAADLPKSNPGLVSLEEKGWLFGTRS